MDELDKKILRRLCAGIGSYEELAKVCDVTRNTVYRRIAALERDGIIKSTLRCLVNFDQLGIFTVIVGAKVSVSEQDKAFNLLASDGNVRFLWRTFGEHNVVLVAFCQKGEEGELIQKMRFIFESVKAADITVSTGFVWKKMELSPFGEDTEIEKKLDQIIEKRY